MESPKRVYVIPHFHYDLAWISSEKENMKTVYKILGRVIEIMERDAGFRYVVDQAFYLERMKRERPRLFRQVAERIREGRIEVVNAGYVMPDLNLVSPLVVKKSLEIMNDFAQTEFDVKPQVAWMIDCFGSPGIMPKIVRETNLKYYVFWRGMNKPESPQEFFWTGTDRTTVLAHWMRHGYGLFGYRFSDLAKAVDELTPTTDIVLVPFGADFLLPNMKLIRQVHDAEGAEFALPSDFFGELEKRKKMLPSVSGEMLSDYANFRGYYSSRVRFKQLYRRAEREVLSGESDEEEWKNLLYASFHDLICGTGIDEVYSEAETKLRKIIVRRKALRKGRAYNGKFLSRISFELKSEEGDLYHTIPSVKVAVPRNSVRLGAFLKDSALHLVVETDFQCPRHVLRLIVSTGIEDGELIHHLWKGIFVKRKLNTSYAFNDCFELREQGGSGFRFDTDDCFDYEVKDNGDVCLTLVRSVQILSHGDAGPRLPCPRALELGKHRFVVSLLPLREKAFS